ncbi:MULTISPECIES: hypothetical protein [unclassified Streptomyces]|uniref:hypothetical protein n=1 Tax=unclassified Streptomyces TaxID=2593676 RepID=UPI0034503730
MTRRPYNRPPEGRNRDRADRRAVVDVLLARAQRGALSRAEGALLAEHVREEQRLADENRRSMIGTTQALERARVQLAAAEAAIVEAERDRDQAEERAREGQRVAAEQRAAVARVITLAGRHSAVPAVAVWAAIDADPVEHRTADDRARRWNAEQGTARVAVDRVRVLAQRMRAGSPQGAAAVYADRIEQALDNDRRALDNDTVIRAQFLAAAESTTARLAEQQRAHEIALAHERRISAGWKRRHLDAEHRAGRYRTAWFAARRDRKADRAAMRADLATMQATAQQLAAVRAALPDEPRPRLGLPNDLAYANGRHDLAERVLYALDTHQPKEHPTA